MVMITDAKISIDRFFFYIGYTFFFSALFINSVAVSVGLQNAVNNILKIVACLFLLMSIFNKKIKYKALPFVFVLFIVGAIFFFSSHDVFFLTLLLIIISSYRANIKGIFIVSRLLLLSLILCVVTACFLGIVPDLLTIRSFFDDYPRHSFGFVHSNIISNCIFVLLSYTLVVKNFSLSKLDIFIYSLLVGITFYYCRGNNGLICTLCLLLLGSISPRKYRWSILLSFIPYIMIVFSFIPSIYISNQDSNEFWIALDLIFTNRISLGSVAIENVGINVINFMNTKEYFSVAPILDNGYLYIGIRYGMILLFLVCYVIRKYLLLLLREDSMPMLYLIVVYLFANLIDNIFFSYMMLPFLICIFKGIMGDIVNFKDEIC